MDSYGWPNYYWSSQTWIDLTLTQVEYLRKLALKDTKLRKILQEFGPHIRVTVDFPGPRG